MAKLKRLKNGINQSILAVVKEREYPKLIIIKNKMELIVLMVVDGKV